MSEALMRTLAVASFVATTLLLGSSAHAQQLDLPRPSPFAKVQQTAGLTEITVDYSSPGVKGRKIWGAVVPYGEVWRAGANNATKVTFGKDVTVGGTPVPAGSYSLFVIPAEKGPWTIALNKDATASAQAYKKELDVVRVEAKPSPVPNRERLVYLIEDFGNDAANIDLEWEKVRVRLPIKLNTEQQVAASLKNLEENPGAGFTSAARYELEQKKDYDAGLKYAEKSIALAPDWLAYWTKAQLLAAKGNHKEAYVNAEKANELGQKSQRFFFADEVKKALKDWKK
jgi:hypothetical protein